MLSSLSTCTAVTEEGELVREAEELWDQLSAPAPIRMLAVTSI